MNVPACLEHRMQSYFLGGILAASVLGNGCVPGPALQRAFTQRGSASIAGQQTSYASTTPYVQPPQNSSSASQNANDAALVADIFSFIAPTPGGRALFGSVGAYARTEAVIEGQKEAAGIIRDGLHNVNSSGNSAQQAPSDGISYTRSREFGTVELIVAPRSVDLNGNGVTDRNELQPAKYMPRNGNIYFAFRVSKGVRNPEFKVLDRNGKIIVQDQAIDEYAGYGSIAFTFSFNETGTYYLALLGEIPQPGPWTQRPFGKLGVPYFIHAMPFEVVEEK